MDFFFRVLLSGRRIEAVLYINLSIDSTLQPELIFSLGSRAVGGQKEIFVYFLFFSHREARVESGHRLAHMESTWQRSRVCCSL